MITQVKHNSLKIAEKIYHVFQASYPIEADLIGVDDFPPLNRTVDDIKNSDTDFYVWFEGEAMAGVIETQLTTDDNECLKICSLIVEPKHFRKGIAGELIQSVLGMYKVDEYWVETAVVNIPAIKLYEKYGFTEYKQYVPDHGIPKVVMRLKDI